LRLAIPVAIYFVLGTVTLSTHYFPGPTESVIASMGLWVVSVAALVRFPSGAGRERERIMEAR
jgi:hypothetical protein